MCDHSRGADYAIAKWQFDPNHDSDLTIHKSNHDSPNFSNIYQERLMFEMKNKDTYIKHDLIFYNKKHSKFILCNVGDV